MVTPPPGNLEWHRRWAEALDALEHDVVSAEALLADRHRARDLPLSDPWTPPQGLGPLPIALRPRADFILERQAAAAEAIAMALATTRRQAAIAGRMDTGRTMSRPAYLDCAL